MIGPLARILIRSPLLRTVVGGLGGAVLAGLGWKLGADMYEGFKRRLKRTPEPEREEPTS